MIVLQNVMAFRTSKDLENKWVNIYLKKKTKLKSVYFYDY